MTKHIFITGGVVSSLGKGITAASLAMLLRRRGCRVAMQKLDPYINVDPGTMSPHQHGEVFVTDDGAETDLDLGHYERFTGIPCTRASNYTTGKIYSAVIARERAGEYLGKTVQVIPHITDEIKSAVRSAGGPDVDIAITEIGGTAGDIESLPFLEAVRQFMHEAGRGNALCIHLTLLPYIRAAGELKTKPSQQSVAILRNIGIIPDILVCRTEVAMEEDHRRKLALFCNVPVDSIVEERDVQHTIYEVPLELARQELDIKVLEALRLPVHRLDLTDWDDVIDRAIHPTRSCRIALVGKYVSTRDAYKSVYEALSHAGIATRAKVEVDMIEAEDLESGKASLEGADGILVPGGFGDRGIPGKLLAIRYAREHGLPLLVICLGMQCIVIEYARNVLGWSDADSTEFAKTAHPVIDLMAEQRKTTAKGGTMRLGAYPCSLKPGSVAEAAYGRAQISERHRHRYEFNNLYREEFENAGLHIAGTSPDEKLVEMVEMRDRPFYVGCQFHPEFKSQPAAPHPLFTALVSAALEKSLDASR